ncbi:MAG: hypothetical protein ACT4P7_19220, partial [Gemmatimonadaceae bacterium]
MATATVTVSRGATANAVVAYSIASGSITISIAGLPTGAPAAVTVTGPGGYSSSVTSASTLGGLTPGAYTVAAAAAQSGGHSYASVNAPTQVQVEASTTPTSVSVSYGIATGAITATASGLPSGQPASAQVTGPAGFSSALAAGETLTNLSPGTYTITGSPVVVGPDQYRTAGSVQLQVAASATPQMAALQYALATGRLSINVSGLPGTTGASVSVTGPANYGRTVTASETLTGLAPGAYTVTPDEVTASNLTYGVPAGAQQVVITASTTPATVSAMYAITRGSLTVVINGLPQSLPARITVTGPGNYTATVATTATLYGLKPGTYTVAAGPANAGVNVYAGTPASNLVTISASATPVQAMVTYALASGILQLTVGGLPPNVNANITVTGPGGYTKSVTGSALVTGLAPGLYTIDAGVAQNGTAYWSAHPASQTITIPASNSAMFATVSYVTANGNLTVNVSGLPAGTAADVRLTGPSGFAQTVTATQTLNGLLEGGYTVTGYPVSSGGTTYSVTPASQPATVGGGVTSSVNVVYAPGSGSPPPGGPLNLTIDGLHVQQVVQSYTNGVPLLSGQDGLLRVFVKANTSNTAAPTVRVRFYNGSTLTSTISIVAPGASVPTTVSQATLNSSWNYLIPASLMVPGLKILADVDPTNAVTEASDTDNSFPTSGNAQTMDVRTLPSFDIRMVPVTQSANGSTGGVTSGNAASYLAAARKLFPLGPVNMDVRAPFTTSAPVLQSNDSNGAWSQILSELNALRTADGSTRYYAGIARVTYSSGIAGLGYVPGRASLSWDYLPSASDVLSHELGHNFGRMHAPCGGAGGPDPGYPYTGGTIGVYGYDLASSALKAPTVTDLMGYCSSNWISDYTYTAVLNYRLANPFIAGAHAIKTSTPRRGLLIWGRIDKGRLTLEPAFEVVARPSLPAPGGPNRLQAQGPLGETLFDFDFDGEHVADATDPTMQHFAFVVPMDMMGGRDVTRLRFSALGRSVERRSSGSTPREAPMALREGARGMRVRWTDPGIQGVLVRDAATGEILTFARGDNAGVVGSAQEL